MAKKHVLEEYDRVCNDYSEMVSTLKEMEEEGFPEERLHLVKEQVAKLKDNYQRWSYFIYLLGKPRRKEKEPSYVRRNKKFLSSIDYKNTSEGERDENKAALEELNNLKRVNNL